MRWNNYLPLALMVVLCALFVLYNAVKEDVCIKAGEWNGKRYCLIEEK